MIAHMVGSRFFFHAVLPICSAREVLLNLNFRNYPKQNFRRWNFLAVSRTNQEHKRMEQENFKGILLLYKEVPFSYHK